MSQPSETSSPAVRQRPWTSASVGIGSASSRRTPSSSGSEARPRARRPASTIRWKTLTSTPPVKMSPSARQTSARASEPSTSSRHVDQRLEGVVAPNRFSGGLWSTIDATAPSRSSANRRAQPSPSPLIRSATAAISSGVAAARDPRQLQRVVLVARDHVEVEVEDRLPGGRPAGVEDVEAVGLERLVHPRAPAGGRRASCARGPRRRSPSGRRECARGTTSAWPRVAGLMSMKATVCSSESTICAGTSPATIPQKRQSLAIGARQPISAAGPIAREPRGRARPPRRGSATSPANTRRLDLAEQPAELGARLDARARRRARRRAIGERGGPSRRQASASASISRASSRWASTISGAAVGPLAPGREPVGDGEQGDVGGDRARWRAGSRRRGARDSGRSWTRKPRRRWWQGQRRRGSRRGARLARSRAQSLADDRARPRGRGR